MNYIKKLEILKQMNRVEREKPVEFMQSILDVGFQRARCELKERLEKEIY